MNSYSIEFIWAAGLGGGGRNCVDRTFMANGIRDARRRALIMYLKADSELHPLGYRILEPGVVVYEWREGSELHHLEAPNWLDRAPASRRSDNTAAA